MRGRNQDGGRTAMMPLDPIAEAGEEFAGPGLEQGQHGRTVAQKDAGLHVELLRFGWVSV
jgi:hypothetical protein